MTNQRSFFSRPRLWGLPWGVLWGLTLAVAQFFTPAGAGTAQAAPNCTDSGQTVTCTYPFTGASETWTVPEGVTQATFQLVGAPGGRSGGRDFAHVDGGRGADLKATLSLVPGTDVIIIVGGPGGTDGDEAGGFNGGGGGQFVGNSYPLAGGGGGATDIRIGGTALTDRVLVAGGGGGGGSYGNGPGLGGAGGTAGGVGGDADMSGFSAPANGPANGGGGGASGNAGGQGGAAGESTANPGGDGSLGQGGTVAENRFFNGAGGGGGGGYVGGGGGGAGGEAFDENANSIGAGGGGGGGGSSFASASATNVALTTDTTKVPKVVITYVDTVAPSVSINQAAGQADPTTSNPVLFSANFNEPVIGFTAQDVTLSGTANLSNATITVNGGPQRYTISVAGLAGNGTVIAAIGANRVTDLVGNGNRASTSTDNIVTVNFDSTPPVITSNVAGTLGSNGWYVSNVTVSWSVVDNESTVTSQSGCDPVTVNSDTVGVTLTCTATSSGGSSSQSVTIKRDATAPTLSAAASSAPNANGWYNRDVTVPFTCNDNLSGVVSCPADETLSREGAAVGSTAQTITDQAGNRSAASNVVTVQIDKTAPVVTVTGVSNGASYPLGSAPAAGCSTSDALSGVATQATLSLTGGGSPLGADGMGSFTATCSGATDNAGNNGSASVTYRVAYNWTGFFQPVDNLPVVNTVNAGQAIPVKFSLGGDYGLNIFATGYPASQQVSCGGSGGGSTSPIEETVTAGNSSLHYDPGTQRYSYVWKTDKAWAGTCRQLIVKLIDGTEHLALFQFNGKGRSASENEGEEVAVQQTFLPLVSR